MPKTDVQKFLEEEKERSERKQQMIETVLAERAEAVKTYDEQLRLLGYQKQIPVAVSSTGIKRQRDPSKPCGQCGAIGHDRRFHRAENIKKKKAS